MVFPWCLQCSETCPVPCPQRLAEWVAIQSVSAWPEKRGEIRHMMEVAAKEIERLGGTTKLMDIGKQKVCEHLRGLVGKHLFRKQGVLHEKVLVSYDPSMKGT